MSFLLGALKGLGSSLLGSIAGKAGGALMNLAKPVISTVGNAISGLFGGGGSNKGDNNDGQSFRGTVSKLGRTAADYLVNKSINAGMGYANQFANSNFLRRKMPMLVPYVKSGAEILGNRLRSGYNELMGNGRTRKGPQVYDTGGNPRMYDSIERPRVF